MILNESKKLCAAAIAYTFVLIGIIFLMNYLMTPEIVTFDMKGTLTAYQKKLLETDTSFEIQKQKLTEFSEVMNQQLDRYQANHNVLILVSGAVVGEKAKDITFEIQKAIITHYMEQ